MAGTAGKRYTFPQDESGAKRWQMDGTVATTDVQNLTVTVQHETVALGRVSSELPIYTKDKTLHPGITEGKLGGHVGQ